MPTMISTRGFIVTAIWLAALLSYSAFGRGGHNADQPKAVSTIATART
jgi:hypothetical protein